MSYVVVEKPRPHVSGRSAFITGQSPVRTGLTKAGLPGSPLGLQKKVLEEGFHE